MNDVDSPAIIGDCEAQDALNVEANLGGTAILKRSGFSQTASLTVSTSAVTGAHTFYDSSGNRIEIVCHDRYCSKSTNGGAFAAFLSTAAAGIKRWSIVDYNGSAYLANDQRDPIGKYDGTTFTSPTGMPRGTILALTPDRLVVGDILNNTNRVHRSSSGAVEQFTTGGNEEDSFYDDVSAPGDHVTGLVYNRFLYIFKTASITACEEGSQYATRCQIVSPKIGTSDPASVVSVGDTVYFRGQDRAYWSIGPRGLEMVSKKIKNLVKSQVSGSDRTNTQTTKADWDSGAQSPTSSWDTTTNNGSIFASSFTAVDTSTTDFAAGTMTQASTAVVSGAGELRAGTVFYNSGFEASSSTGGWLSTGSFGVFTSSLCGTASTGDFSLGGVNSFRWTHCDSSFVFDSSVTVVNASNNAVLYTYRSSGTATQGCDGASLNLSTQPVQMKIRFESAGSYAESPSLSSGAFVGGVFYFGVGGKQGGTGLICGGGGIDYSAFFDTYEPYYIASGTFTAQSRNTGSSAVVWGLFKATVTTPAGTTINFNTQVASATTGPWDTAVAVISDGQINSARKQYVRYNGYYTLTSATVTWSLQAAEENYASTAAYRTQCIQPGASISAWGTLSCGETKIGAGSLVYYTTSAATCATLPSGTPMTWQTTTANNSVPTIGVNTAMYIGWSNLLGASTDQAQVDACTIAWTEGTPAQPVWSVYDSIRNAIFWTTTINNATYANRLLKYDLNRAAVDPQLGWFPYALTASAPLMVGTDLYFGGASSGTWNRFGITDADGGAAINAYWKTKDIGAAAPFQEKDFRRVSLLNRNQGSGALTATWTLSNGKTGSYTPSLSTGTLTYARSNYNLPASSPQNFINLNLGNNAASQPFEILGIQVDFYAQPWRAGGP